MNNYYKEQLEEALEYQDFVVQVMMRRGTPICVYSSRKNQYKAESANGYEIKYDKRFKKTGRLYIETHEKTSHTNSKWVESGILKNDNSKYIIIGDYEHIFIFSKHQLVREYKQCKWNPVNTQTSQGIVIDVYENRDKGEFNKEFEFLCLEKIIKNNNK